VDSPFEALSVHLAIPDLWQQQALVGLREGKDVVVDAPTGAGKTWIFELFIEQEKSTGQAVYTVPTRALANDKRREWQERGWRVGIATGDLAEDTDAPVLVATLETQLEPILAGKSPALLVIDEYQMLADPNRGLHYETAIAMAQPETQFLLLSGSVSNPQDVAAWLERLGRRTEVVRTSERPVPLDEMSQRSLEWPAPKSVTGFFPRLAAEVLMADLGPLLIFTPQRNKAESIARKIAAALPPPQKPIQLTDAQRHACGKELSGLVESRIAYHHSGLAYPARGGVIEPLAKAGQLRIIVATTGLAAGINFSVRSVAIASTTYQDGPHQRALRPDELLQMFGRAGRRGLDDAGYVITSDRSPQLMDSAPRKLRRGNAVDWTTLIRAMSAASERGESAPEAARTLCQNLFSQQRIHLGFTGGKSASKIDPEDTDAMAFIPGLSPVERQFRNSVGEWEKADPARLEEVSLSDSHHWHRDELRPALQAPPAVDPLLPELGRLCRLDHSEAGWVYGRERALAVAIEDKADTFRPNKATAKKMRTPKDKTFSQADFESWATGAYKQARLAGLVQRGDTLYAQFELANLTVPVRRDRHGIALVRAEERMQSLDIKPTLDGAFDAAPGTAAYAWRKLGLIEPDGTPTRRGRVFSLFNGGEGLAVAAALEDTNYSIGEIIDHLANLRGGSRFDTETGGSEQLAGACRAAYGPASYDGYLELGLPLGYGHGASEVLQDKLTGRRRDPKTIAWGPGDLERVTSEWLSLLRHISHCPELDWDRWQDLQKAASLAVRKHTDSRRAGELPPIPASQLQAEIRHRLFFRR